MIIRNSRNNWRESIENSGYPVLHPEMNLWVWLGALYFARVTLIEESGELLEICGSSTFMK